MRRFPLPLLAVVLAALALAPVAIAATKSYKGKNENNRTLTFKVKGKKVTDFVGGINLFCIGEGIQFNAVIPPKAMKIKGKTFKYRGDDKEGNGSIDIKGRLKGKKATGTMSMVTSRYSASEGRVISCSGDTKWTAKVR